MSKDVISLALGHEFGCKTTSIYIDYDMEKVDKANRQVLDYLKNLK
ncbi:tyrosine type site-specific recombinase domain protein [Bacteroides fragilis str. Ds-233]|nr:tyrosine type site-specific recombinase domain protein [Bacteroides fragilis str. Ds-233]